MNRPFALVPTLVCTLAGCDPWTASQLVTPRDPNQAFSVPNEDGSRYVVVESGARTPAHAMARRWSREATAGCKGEYIVLSQGGAVRQARGKRATRLHEGWVRCLNPEATEDVTPETPTT